MDSPVNTNKEKQQLRDFKVLQNKYIIILYHAFKKITKILRAKSNTLLSPRSRRGRVLGTASVGPLWASQMTDEGWTGCVFTWSSCASPRPTAAGGIQLLSCGYGGPGLSLTVPGELSVVEVPVSSHVGLSPPGSQRLQGQQQHLPLQST